jgi:hypothetical protein
MNILMMQIKIQFGYTCMHSMNIEYNNSTVTSCICYSGNSLKCNIDISVTVWSTTHRGN